MKYTAPEFAKSKYLELSEYGSRLNLSFSSHLKFGNRIIALDGLKRRLLVLETDKELKHPYVIDLEKVAAISVKKSYGKINHGELKNKRIEEFLKKIDLQFEFSNSIDIVVLPFYDCESDNQKDRPKLERNAKNWQLILSKLAGSQLTLPDS
jgi:hypothetical protein